jgi:hypothetical protein
MVIITNIININLNRKCTVYCIPWLLRKYGIMVLRLGFLLKILGSHLWFLFRLERYTLSCFQEWETWTEESTDFSQEALSKNGDVLLPSWLAKKQISISACTCLLPPAIPLKVEGKYHLLILYCLLVQQNAN